MFAYARQTNGQMLGTAAPLTLYPGKLYYVATFPAGSGTNFFTISARAGGTVKVSWLLDLYWKFDYFYCVKSYGLNIDSGCFRASLIMCIWNSLLHMYDCEVQIPFIISYHSPLPLPLLVPPPQKKKSSARANNGYVTDLVTHKRSAGQFYLTLEFKVAPERARMVQNGCRGPCDRHRPSREP